MEEVETQKIIVSGQLEQKSFGRPSINRKKLGMVAQPVTSAMVVSIRSEDCGPCYPVQKLSPYLQNNKSKMS
jgi:hypothetical protein